jgi:AcrR family transcriptional regulator
MKFFRVYICDMKSTAARRTYHMEARAKAVAENDRKIMDAVADLWLNLPLLELTLEKVADQSGVTVRTILRKFGSKEGLLKACIENYGGRFTQDRMKVTPGNLPEILDALLEEYELMGEANIRALTVEHEFPFTQIVLKKARKIHRDWCRMVFKPFLPAEDSKFFEIRLSAFIAATEFYLWKLLRKDLGKSLNETRQIFLHTLTSLANNSKTS